MMKKVFSMVLLIMIIFTISGQTTQKFEFKMNPVTPTIDFGVLTGTTIYWMYGNNVQPDKVIHFMFGYFGTQAMNYILKPLNIPKGFKVAVPILVFGGLAFFKEMADTKPEWEDFYMGMAGCGLSVISFNLTYKF